MHIKTLPRLLPLSIALASGVHALGCASDCDKIRKQYEQTIADEQPFVTTIAEGDDLPIHIGVAIRNELLNEVVDRALRAVLAKALTTTDEISLSTGQNIGLVTKGAVADVGLYPDSACDNCLRVDGRLDGELTVKLPVLGSQRVPLGGSFSLVAPVVFGRNADGDAEVKLDLAQAAKLGRSHVDPTVTGLPPTWWKVIEAPLSRQLVDAVTKQLPPVTLFSFAGPDLGIEGLDIVPARLVTDSRRGVVFAGFHTNLAVAEGAALKPQTDLGKNDDLAIGIDRRVLTPMAKALVKSSNVPRRWTSDGKESAAGPIHVTIHRMDIDPTGGEFSSYVLDFRAWNLPAEGKCWWADTRASGRVTVAEGEAAVSIGEVKLVEGSMPDIFRTVANWRTSAMLRKSANVVTRSLAPDGIDFPGGSITPSKATLRVDDDAAWLYGTAELGDEKRE